MEKYGCTNMTNSSTKKIVSLRENLLATISSKFGVDLTEEYILKYYDMDMAEWFDVDDVNEIEGNILRLYPRKSLMEEDEVKGPVIVEETSVEVASLRAVDAEEGPEEASMVTPVVPCGNESDSDDGTIKSFKQAVAKAANDISRSCDSEDDSADHHFVIANGNAADCTNLETPIVKPLPELRSTNNLANAPNPKQLLPQFAIAKKVPEINHQSKSVKKRKYLLSPYTLEDVTFPPHLLARLSDQLPLNKNHRAELLKAISDDVYLYVKYPTSEQYSQIARAILSNWPYLSGEEIENTAWTQQDAFDAMKGKVLSHFRNSRKRWMREDEEVAGRIEIATNQRSNKDTPRAGSSSRVTKPVSKAAGKRAGNCWNIPNFQPAADGGEDDTTLAHHQKLLQVEAGKDPKKVNLSIVKTSMKKTFPARREMELAGVKLADIKESYPFLFSRSGLLNEFDTIMESDIENTFYGRLDKVALKLYSLPKRGDENFGLAELRKLYNLATDLKDSADRMRSAAIFIVAAHMDENVDELFTENPIGYLRNERKGLILRTSAVMEGTVLMESKNLIEAFMCLMASFYVFHIDYPKEMQRTLKFFQMEIMDVRGKTDKKDSVMRSLWQKIHH